MEIIKTADEFVNWRSKQSDSIGFIPTLGALHDGHMSLIKESQKNCKITIVSIFLNPTQFSANEDLDSYPNTHKQDIYNLNCLNVDVLFLPNETEMYQNVCDVNVPSSELFNKLEGKSRPHFFYGVTTIVAKLFNIIQPTHTFFGQKDAQQLIIIKEMIMNMKYPITLVSCPTIRDKNGLALSSRNNYLNDNEQQQAAIIHQSLMKIKEKINQGIFNTNELKNIFKKNIITNRNINIDYISIADMKTLKEVDKIKDQKVLVSVAVFLKNVRLIDNFIY
tara:strand:- start:296 stop:1129 length:834 start_codon:yes stop_codon:yes gene_type:complete